jgi:hypothetical protein
MEIVDDVADSDEQLDSILLVLPSLDRASFHHMQNSANNVQVPFTPFVNRP